MKLVAMNPQPSPERTRERWMLDAVALMSPIFARAGYEVPVVRISVGWTSKGASVKNGVKRVAECLSGSCAGDGINQILVTPETADEMTVLDHTAHELAHAVLDCQGGHGRPFQKVMAAVGLVGKPEHAGAGPLLRAQLEKVAAQLGPFPHSAVDLGKQPGPKKQTCRQLKVICPTEGCNWYYRQPASLIRRGRAACPCCGAQMIPDAKAQRALDGGQED